MSAVAKSDGGESDAPGWTPHATANVPGDSADANHDAVTTPAAATAATTQAVTAIQQLVALDAAAFTSLGAHAPLALLLSGPPGVGKTHAVRHVARATALPLHVISPAPNARATLTAAFVAARRAPRALVFVDELDALCAAPRGADASAAAASAGTSLAALLAALLDPPPEDRSATCVDGRSGGRGVVYVVAATNRPAAVHPCLLRAGRFDRHVSLTPPPAAEREALLVAMHPPLAADACALHALAQACTGFVAADFVALRDAAARLAASVDTAVLNPGTTTTTTSAPTTTTGPVAIARHFAAALPHFRPAVLRSSLAPRLPAEHWHSVAGLSDVKRRLRIAVEWPTRHASTFETLGLRAPRGILLHGPPGCSKTTLVRAAATAAHLPFLRLTGADVFSAYVGEAERILRDAFAKARTAAPCVLFIDELDAVAGRRDVAGAVDGNRVQQRVLSTLLTEMDGVESADGVLVIAATNRVDMIDDALLRPGRFDDVLYVGLPDLQTREEVLRIHASRLPLTENVDLRALARRTDGWSGAHLKGLCHEAGSLAMREFMRNRAPAEDGPLVHAAPFKVSMRHFEANC